MSVSRTILGGIVAACVMMGTAIPVIANTAPDSPDLTSETRPFSRDDAIVLRVAAQRAALAGYRPAARPTFMLRYPPHAPNEAPAIRPLARNDYHPPARWDHRPGGEVWTRAALSSIVSHGNGLETLVPRDIDAWCPGYTNNSPELRRAFWVGMMSSLAKHESTWRPEAVGGGDLWYGLLQIYPDTARRYGCYARTGADLKDATDNLSCAVRIMAVTVRRDNAIAVRDTRWRGVAADWGPMTNRSKIAEMSAWTRQQPYCERQSGLTASLRPQLRPNGLNPTSLPIVEAVSIRG